MRIEETRIFYMYLSDEEFELLHEICGEFVDYGYHYSNGCWITKLLSEQMIINIEDLLEKEHYHQLYEECNRGRADRIKELINNIDDAMQDLMF